MRNLQINHDLFFNYDLSQIYFNDNFKHIKGDTWLYIDYGNLSQEFCEDDFFIINYEKTKKRNVNKLKLELSDDGYIRNIDLDDLISTFLYYSNLDDLELLLNEYNIIYSKAYSSLVIRGYNQGDIAQVFTNIENYKKVYETDFIEDEYIQYFENLFYNSPICGEFDITFDYTTKKGINHTFKLFDDNICEYLKNIYELKFDIDYIIKKINKNLIDYKLNKDEIKEIISELNSLDYEVIRS